MASGGPRQPGAHRPAPASSRELLGTFQPGSEAEPPGLETAQPADTTPTVLNKLQKWADYAAVGAPVWPTKFIPMKTPMSREILDNWSLAGPPKHPLTVPLLLEGQAAQGRTVGLIIDLANHDCLYSDDVPDTIEYEHVQLIAKVLPSREAIDEVERIAASFWGEHPDQYIAIHCAYGFNRTGFVVCSYLCQACGLSVEQALESFAAARPPGVKHEKFIRELFARYGTASQVPTPEGSVAATSPPEADMAVVDALAAEAESLLAAAASAEQSAAQPSPQQQAREQGGAAPPKRAQQQASPPMAVQQRPQQQGERRARRRSSEDEPPHFEDAADSLHRRSVQRQHSRSESSAGGSRGGSQHGSAVAAAAAEAVAAVAQQQQQSLAPPQQQPQHLQQAPQQQQQPPAGAEQGEEAEEEGLATTAGAPETFVGSRRLLQRKHSRGGSGGLALALSRHSIDGSSPGGSGTGSGAGSAVACGSPMSQSRTARSSYSDFAAAAQHLEGANSMRRTTSLGLAKALCEDFLQNNGTPSAVAPITAAATWDDEQLAAAGLSASGGASPNQRQPAGAARSPGGASSVAGSEAGGSQAGDGPTEEEADAACWLGSSPPKASGGSQGLACSPSKRGGIPLPRNSSGAMYGSGAPVLPPVRAQAAMLPLAAWQQPPGLQPAALGGQAGQQPGTPLTPASSNNTPSALGSSFQRSATGFLRSVSVDSDNPSLGFGAREALQQLRAAQAGVPDGLVPSRGPQALADLFREDSRGELAALDVDEHMQALALAAGLDSPPVAGPLPNAIAAACSSAAAAQAVGAGAPGGVAGGPAAQQAGQCAAASAPAAAVQPGARLQQQDGKQPPPAQQRQQQQRQQQQRQQHSAAASPHRGRAGAAREHHGPCSIM